MNVNLYIMTDITSLKPKDGKYIYILECPTAKGPATLTKAGTLENKSSNSADITVLEAALGRLNKASELEIYTENQYTSASLQYWMKNWKANGFKDSKGDDIKHQEEWMRISALLEKHTYNVHLKELYEYKTWMQNQLKGDLVNDYK